MNGVKFDDMHSIKDWQFLMTDKNIGYPEVDTNYLKISGRDGMLDLTEANGGVKYSNRTLTFTFDIFQNPNEWTDIKSNIDNFLHGKKHKIILDTDNKYYYFGRCKISSFTHETTVAHMSIECNCEPYKYKLIPTKKKFDFSFDTKSKKISIYNEMRKVVPKITSNKDIQIEFGGQLYELKNGENIILDIELQRGENIFNVISDGISPFTVIFEYQEAKL